MRYKNSVLTHENRIDKTSVFSRPPDSLFFDENTSMLLRIIKSATFNMKRA
jgi:hypothetical protein